jgi:transposase
MAQARLSNLRRAGAVVGGRNGAVVVEDEQAPAAGDRLLQALRPCVIFRKVTNCFRSEWGATLYADIRSVVETARRNAVGAFQAIRITLVPQPLADTG